MQYYLSEQSLIEKAKRSAEKLFRDEVRWITRGAERLSLPYVEHLWEVAALLEDTGYSRGVVTAGILHSHTAHSSEWGEVRIEREFSPDIARLVYWVAEQHRSLPWSTRASMLISKLAHAPKAALAVECACLISSFRSISGLTASEFLRNEHTSFGWDPFNATLAQCISFASGVLELSARRVEVRLIGELRVCVQEFETKLVQVREIDALQRCANS